MPAVRSLYGQSSRKEKPAAVQKTKSIQKGATKGPNTLDEQSTTAEKQTSKEPEIKTNVPQASDQANLRFVYKTAREMEEKLKKEGDEEQKQGGLKHFAKVVVNANTNVRQKKWLLNLLQAGSHLHKLQQATREQLSRAFPNVQLMTVIVQKALTEIPTLEAECNDVKHHDEIVKFRDEMSKFATMAQQIGSTRNQALNYLSRMVMIAEEEGKEIELEPELVRAIRAMKASAKAAAAQDGFTEVPKIPLILLQMGKKMTREILEASDKMAQNLNSWDVKCKGGYAQGAAIAALPPSWFECLDFMNELSEQQKAEQEREAANAAKNHAEIQQWKRFSIEGVQDAWDAFNMWEEVEERKNNSTVGSRRKKMTVVNVDSFFNTLPKAGANNSAVGGGTAFRSQRSVKKSARSQGSIFTGPPRGVVDELDPECDVLSFIPDRDDGVQDGIKDLIKRASHSTAIRKTLTVALGRHIHSDSDDERNREDSIVSVTRTERTSEVSISFLGREGYKMNFGNQKSERGTTFGNQRSERGTAFGNQRSERATAFGNQRSERGTAFGPQKSEASLSQGIRSGRVAANANAEMRNQGQFRKVRTHGGVSTFQPQGIPFQHSKSAGERGTKFGMQRVPSDDDLQLLSGATSYQRATTAPDRTSKKAIRDTTNGDVVADRPAAESLVRSLDDADSEQPANSLDQSPSQRDTMVASMTLLSSRARGSSDHPSDVDLSCIVEKDEEGEGVNLQGEAEVQQLEGWRLLSDTDPRVASHRSADAQNLINQLTNTTVAHHHPTTASHYYQQPSPATNYHPPPPTTTHHAPQQPLATTQYQPEIPSPPTTIYHPSPATNHLPHHQHAGTTQYQPEIPTLPNITHHQPSPLHHQSPPAAHHLPPPTTQHHHNGISQYQPEIPTSPNATHAYNTTHAYALSFNTAHHHPPPTTNNLPPAATHHQHTGTAQQAPAKLIETLREPSPPRAASPITMAQRAKNRRFIPHGLPHEEVTIEQIYRQRDEMHSGQPRQSLGPDHHVTPHAASTASLMTANHMNSTASLSTASLLTSNNFALITSHGSSNLQNSCSSLPRSMKVDSSSTSLMSAQTQVNGESHLWTKAASQTLLEADDMSTAHDLSLPRAMSSSSRKRCRKFAPIYGHTDLTPPVTARALPVSSQRSVEGLANATDANVFAGQDIDGEHDDSFIGDRENAHILIRQGTTDEHGEVALIRNGNSRSGIVHFGPAGNCGSDSHQCLAASVNTSNNEDTPRSLHRIGDLNLRSLRAQDRRGQSNIRTGKKGLRNVFNVFPYLTDDHGQETTKETPWPDAADRFARVAAAGPN